MKSIQSSRSRGMVVYLLFVALALSGCAGSPAARRNKYIARGKQLAEKHDYARAILEFKNAAKAAPKDAEVFYQLGMAYLGVQDFRSALGGFPPNTGAQSQPCRGATQNRSNARLDQ